MLIEQALLGRATLQDVFISVSMRHASVFRIVGSASGICVMQIHNDGKERALFVWLLAGKKLLLHLTALGELMEQIAQVHGCSKIIASPTKELVKVYKSRLGFVDHPLGIAKEIHLGWQQN